MNYAGTCFSVNVVKTRGGRWGVQALILLFLGVWGVILNLVRYNIRLEGFRVGFLLSIVRTVFRRRPDE